MLRKPLRANPARQPVASAVSLPPSVGGLNARDSIATMPPQDALQLDNLFPQASYLELRRGYRAWATGLPGAVHTVMEYAGDTRALFAASVSGIYDVSGVFTASTQTPHGAVSAAVVTGVGSAKFQTTMFSNTGGTYLIAVNGTDGVRTFNGTTWAVQTITGATAANFFQVVSWKRRLWFAEVNTSKVWYLGSDAIAGAATSLDLGGVWRLGGTIARIIAASFDSAGSGLSEYIGFLSTNGEMAVYNGSDPASIDTFALVGVYRMGAPVGDRCTAQTGGDVAAITADGIVSVMGMMQIDRTQAARVAVTNKIDTLFADAVRIYGVFDGWQALSYPAGHMTIVNVPQTSSTAIQYVMNTLTGAWCRFTNQPAGCWALYNEALFFGGLDGVVYQADYGNSDEGDPIPALLQTAFSGFGAPQRGKRFTLLRPLMTANAAFTPSVGMAVDYGGLNLQASYSGVASSASLFGAAVFGTSRFSGEALVLRQWQGIGKQGWTASIGMRFGTLNARVKINGFDVMMEAAQGPGL